MPLYLGNRPIGGTNVSFTPGTGGSEDLTAVLNEQDAIITRLETALEGKASGGGSAVETCTVDINVDQYARIAMLLYSHLDENGKVTTTYREYGERPTNTIIPLDNVICGSACMIIISGVSPGVESDTAVELGSLYGYTIKMPTVADTTNTIYVYGDY